MIRQSGTEGKGNTAHVHVEETTQQDKKTEVKYMRVGNPIIKENGDNTRRQNKTGCDEDKDKSLYRTDT